MMFFHKDQIVGRWLIDQWPELKHEIHRKFRDARIFLMAPWRFLKNVWLFRKELWRFRQWDHSFNLAIFARSLELTAEHLDSKYCVTENGPRDAADIRKFIRMLEISENPIKEAERIMGRDYFDVHGSCYPGSKMDWNEDTLWRCKPQEEWTPAQKDYNKMHVLIQQLEERSWKNAWKFYSRKGRHWWD
jgi:hypothetical protein